MRLAWRLLLRDWRAGELRVLLAALVVSVMSITSVGFLADRARLALERDVHTLLGGDLLLQSDHPPPTEWRLEAVGLGLRVAESRRLVSMARTGRGDVQAAQLVSLRAVDEGYPLSGRIQISTGLPSPAGGGAGGEGGGRTGRLANATRTEINHGPAPGTVWADSRFFDLTGARVGDPIELGDTRFTLVARLDAEPDRGLVQFDLAPRVMMRLEDLPATGLVQEGSRVNYQFHLAGGKKAVAAYRAWLSPRLQRGQQLQGLDNARPELRSGLDRAQRFFGLAALLAVVLAATAMHLAARRYVSRHLDGYAVMRCLGATQARLVGLFGGQLLLLGALGGGLGGLLGYAAQALLGRVMGELLGADLPAPSPLPALQGWLAGYLLLLGFALPPLWRLKRVPALRVLRREALPLESGALILSLAGLAVLAALLVWQTGDARLAAWTLGGFLAAGLTFTLIGLVLLRLLGRLGRGAGSFAWRYGLASLGRRAAANGVQTAALALGLTALLLLAFTRGDLLDAWRGKTPADAPNRFIINIQPEQRDALGAWFTGRGLAVPELYPMVRGRLLAINGRPVVPEDYPEDRARRLAEREFNLSYMAGLPGHNRLTAGRWFGGADLAGGALSVETGIAQTLGIRLGDRLTWSVAGETFSAPVTNLRAVDWDSMRVNFFVITTPALLRDMPASYLTSFHLPADRAKDLNGLVRELPNLTVIDTTAILTQALDWMERLVGAVQTVFLFALAAGVLVLYAALVSTRDERLREAALLRALGAARPQLRGALLAEFAVLGLLSGLLASTAAAAIGAVLAARVFELDYAPDPWLWLAGPALGLGCVALNALAGLRTVLNAPPMVSLREG
ncbi:MAG TPA: FtsX-like permease family protein [Thiobacillaceae bacterium]|nr:FtsX-like permease family protein [Thiobacillaceae bacterium]